MAKETQVPVAPIAEKGSSPDFTANPPDVATQMRPSAPFMMCWIVSVGRPSETSSNSNPSQRTSPAAVANQGRSASSRSTCRTSSLGSHCSPE